MKIAVITGSSKGIGLAIANDFLSRGYKVYGISRSRSEIENENFVWLECDLYDGTSIKNALKLVLEDQIEALVCNAGTAEVLAIEELSIESYKRTFDLNVLAPILITQDLFNKLENSLIINISSVSDRIVEKDWSLYCASKAANTRFFETVAIEIPTARVFNILPTYVDTPLQHQLHNNDGFDFDVILSSSDIADLARRLDLSELDVPSGSNIMTVNTATIEDLANYEKLYGYVADIDELRKLN